MEIHGTINTNELLINSNKENIGIHTTIFSYGRDASKRRTYNILQYNSNKSGCILHMHQRTMIIICNNYMQESRLKE